MCLCVSVCVFRKKKSQANDRMTKIAIASADRELLKYNKMDVPTLRKELAKINEVCAELTHTWRGERDQPPHTHTHSACLLTHIGIGRIWQHQPEGR